MYHSRRAGAVHHLLRARHVAPRRQGGRRAQRRRVAGGHHHARRPGGAVGRAGRLLRGVAPRRVQRRQGGGLPAGQDARAGAPGEGAAHVAGDGDARVVGAQDPHQVPHAAELQRPRCVSRTEKGLLAHRMHSLRTPPPYRSLSSQSSWGHGWGTSSSCPLSCGRCTGASAATARRTT